MNANALAALIFTILVGATLLLSAPLSYFTAFGAFCVVVAYFEWERRQDPPFTR